MKIGFLITLLLTGIHFGTFAQETSENKIFDYAETKHELSLDIAPIINGNYPSSFFIESIIRLRMIKTQLLGLALAFQVILEL
jgi:hypothetical protein